MVVTVVLLHKESIFHSTIELGQEITIGSHKNDDLLVEDFASSQIQIKWKNSGIVVNAKNPYDFESNAIPLDTIVILNRDDKTALFFSTLTSTANNSLKLPYNCLIKIGRTETNDVVLNIPFVSAEHLVIKNEAGRVRIEDRNSTNGIYLNGKRVAVAKMKSGDVLSILSIRIKLLNGELLFENVGQKIQIKNISDEKIYSGGHADPNSKKLIYRRSPRTQDTLPNEDIILSPAPSKSQKYEKNRGVFSSLLGSGAMFAANMITAAASPALLAARAASLVSPVASVASSTGSNKKRKRSLEQYENLRREKYGAYIADQKARIESVAKTQREIISKENMDAAECIDIVLGLKRNLWERMPSDRDFLDVRVGMGYEDLCVTVKSRTDAHGFQMEDDDVRELTEQIIEETRIVDNVPARLSLLKNNTVGFVGKREKVVNLVRNMLISLATLHCYEDVKIIGIFDESERHIWEPLKWLPHIWDEEKQFRNISFDKRSCQEICDMFNDIVKKRKFEAKDTMACTPVIPRPYYIFIFGSRDLMEKEEIMKNLFGNSSSVGVSSLFLFDDIYMLPHGCQWIVDVDNGPCAYDRSEANNKFYFTMDDPVNEDEFDSFARRMSAVELIGFSSKAGLPSGVSFLAGYGVKTVDELNILAMWDSSVPYKSLAAPIGMLEGNKPFFFDIHEKVHGPHGLIAGTTGSGKSELIQTWVLSMALNYHPYDVSFVIIDYKGGGMANLLEPLPHVVGKITNIGSNISRSLISLNSEIKRRYAIFEKNGVNHIDKYQKLYKSKSGMEPLPHLIIVCDEFAELKKEEPDFMAGLISASRVGRSLGIHLVLATQKPGGVVDDQIQSNSRFRLCLKVQDINDSREMIKRPDAAKISQAGRAYIRVGEDEYFDLFQSFWSGAPYHGETEADQDNESHVCIVDLHGRRIRKPKKLSSTSSNIEDELSAIVKRVCEVADAVSIERLHGPWLPELPTQIYVDELLEGVGFDGEKWNGEQEWLKVPIGRYDIPSLQKQGIQYLDFSTDGHYGIYGASGTGKTTLLKGIVTSLCRNYTPQDVNIYILDCGGWSMSSFATMPHVGGVALDGEDEKFFKLEKMISQEFEARKKAFLKNAVSSLQAYREVVSTDMPAIVIAIDNIVPIFDLYPDLENLFISIARDGATYGIYLVYTSGSTSGVRYKVLQNIKGAIAFELTDKSDYASIVGRLEGSALPKIKGRALFKSSSPIEFQAALYAHGANDREKSMCLAKLADQMNDIWDGVRPKRIPVMPETVLVEEMIGHYQLRTVIPIGISSENVDVYNVDLSSNYSMLVTGSLHSGKSDFLCKLAGMIGRKFHDTKIYVFDGISSPCKTMSELVHGYCLVTDQEKTTSLLEELVQFLNERKKAQNKARQMEDSSFDEKKFIARYEMLCIIIDDLREFIDSVSDENKNTMERICRMAQDLGVIVLCGGRMADIAKYNEIESLTRVVVGNQNGVTTSGTPAQHTYFLNNLRFTDRDTEAGENLFYCYSNGKCTKVRLMQ